MNISDPKVRKAIMGELGRSGGNKRRSVLTPDRRTEIARKAARARWDAAKTYPAPSPTPQTIMCGYVP